jgi:hypothetical protein
MRYRANGKIIITDKFGERVKGDRLISWQGKNGQKKRHPLAGMPFIDLLRLPLDFGTQEK